MVVIFVGVSGVTCGGKTSLAEKLAEKLENDGVNVSVINQDDHYRSMDEMERVEHLNHWNFELPSAINFETLKSSIRHQLPAETINTCVKKSFPHKVVLIEGITLFADQELKELCNLRYFIRLNYEECKRRRDLRTDYIPPDVPGYFDDLVWPAYIDHEKEVRNQNKNVGITFVDGSQPRELILENVLRDIREAVSPNWVRIQSDPLDVSSTISFVTIPSCGAVSVFLGVTRNNFNGKRVVKLEYEAYNSMALAKMESICEEARTMWPSIVRIAIHHRIGEVKVTEPSVVITVSSPHRKDAQLGSQFLLDTLKEKVPVWKKEVFIDGSQMWKENPEWKKTKEKFTAA